MEIKKIISFLVLVTINACNYTTEPNNTPSNVTEMIGIWNMTANFDFQYKSQTYTLDVTNSAIQVGEILNSKWPYYFKSSMKDLKLSCKQKGILKWEVSLDSLNIDFWRSILYVGIKFNVSTPFGELVFDCMARYDEKDVCQGDGHVDSSTTDSLLYGNGKWNINRFGSTMY